VIPVAERRATDRARTRSSQLAYQVAIQIRLMKPPCQPHTGLPLPLPRQACRLRSQPFGHGSWAFIEALSHASRGGLYSRLCVLGPSFLLINRSCGSTTETYLDSTDLPERLDFRNFSVGCVQDALHTHKSRDVRRIESPDRGPESREERWRGIPLAVSTCPTKRSTVTIRQAFELPSGKGRAQSAPLTKDAWSGRSTTVSVRLRITS